MDSLLLNVKTVQAFEPVTYEAHKGQLDKAGSRGFLAGIINALRCVTKTSENENYDDFIDRVKKNPLAVAVKINDLTDNMDIRRLPYLSDKDVKRLKKYLKAYKRLMNS